MLDFLKGWIEGIVVAVIVVSIFEMIIPNGNIKKYIKVVLGIYIVFCIISPFVNKNELYKFNISDALDDFNLPKSSNTSEDNIEKMYIETLEKEIANTVEEEGYTISSCRVDAEFDTNSKDFGIKNIEIILSSKNDKKSVNTSKIESVNKVEININDNVKDNGEESITSKDTRILKKVLCEHYEIDENIINIQF